MPIAVIFNAGRVALAATEKGWALPILPPDITPEGETFAISDDVIALRVSDKEIPGLMYIPLRESYRMLSESQFAMAAKGVELLNWSAGMRYCAKCGSALHRHSAISFICSDCGKEYFPVLSPAVVVLVTRGEEALLVHAANFSRPFHALVAGFVETGESAEQCVAREVREETTLEIEDIRYFGSQSWPFPHQLMLGFTAKWKSGELKFADGELTSGGFFTRDNVPELPTPPSLSRAIIDAWLEKKI